MLAGCAERGEAIANRMLTVTLAATPVNAGEIGRAFLVARGDKTDVVVEVSGMPPMLASRPVHLYTFIHTGRCSNLGEPPAYALTARVLAESARSGGATPATGPFKVSNTARLPLEALRGGRYAIVIRTSPADGGREIFCGNVD
jgi:hypothetical protein